MLSPFKDLRPEQEQQIQALMDKIYWDFIGKVGMSCGKGWYDLRERLVGVVGKVGMSCCLSFRYGRLPLMRLAWEH